MIGRLLKTFIVAIVVWAGVNLAAWTYLERLDEQARAQAAGVPYDVIKRFEKCIASVRDGEDRICGTLPFRLFRPTHFEPKRHNPVILYLHGSGNRGNDNIRQVQGVPSVLTEPDLQAQFPCYVIVPQCPQGVIWSDRSIQVNDKRCDGLTLALAAVDQVLTEYAADPDRVYLIGYSMGAYGAWELAAREPERFASVVPIAGGGNPEWANRLVGVPIRAVHGDADEVVPVSNSREMVAAIRTVGGSLRYDEIAGTGHAAWKSLLADPFEFSRWLHQHTRSARGNISRTAPQGSLY